MNAPTRGVGSYALVTAAYWGFTVTDGALRMLVLLHFHQLGYTPFQLALLFLSYEALGVVTTLAGGLWSGRTGLKFMLLLGLGLQEAGMLMLAKLSSDWAVASQVIYVLAAQALSGIAKDLVKVASKSAIKLVVPGDQQGQLFRWVARLTGSKNALKGIGFFVGSALLTRVGFEFALLWMSLALGLVYLVVFFGLSNTLGRARSKLSLSSLVADSPHVNYLSLARLFLFGSRDIWFAVAVPVFLAESLGWEFEQIGSFFALWVVGYGAIQAVAPRLFTTAHKMHASRSVLRWGLALASIAFGTAFSVDALGGTALVVGLCIFGCIFAVNSSLHSYLILRYANAGDVAASVGLYYMANALGRLVGTLLSGWVYQVGGLSWCLLISGGMLVAAAVAGLGLRSALK